MDRKITVEDLLRLKRAERPPAEFWARFETEIRSKQLSAIVNRRPWWHGISRALAMVNRNQLPFGAAAALALTWAGLHYAASPSQIVRSNEVKLEANGLARVAGSVSHIPAVPVAERVTGSREEVVDGSKVAAPVHSEGVTATASHLTRAPSDISLDAVSKSPFADGIAVSLADYREPSSEYARRSVFGSDSEFEPSIAQARQAAADPLARMDPAQERRSRLLAPGLPAYASGNPRSLAGDWMKSRASSNERMYESMDHESNDRMLVGFRF